VPVSRLWPKRSVLLGITDQAGSLSSGRFTKAAQRGEDFPWQPCFLSSQASKEQAKPKRNQRVQIRWAASNGFYAHVDLHVPLARGQLARHVTSAKARLCSIHFGSGQGREERTDRHVGDSTGRTRA